MKVLVTGAGGFIGSHLSNHLVEQGCDVIGVDLHYSGAATRDRHPRLHAIVGDFRNRNLMETLMPGVQVVFHLASAHLQLSLAEADYWDINVHSLRPLLELAHRSGVQRFIHVSSVGVYGNLNVWPANEDTPCQPQSIYGETKLAGEQEVFKFSDETGLPVVIIRPAWVYGPGCPRTSKLYRSLRNGRFVMIGKGENLRHPIYIADMLQAFDLAMKQAAAVKEVFVIAGERAITTKELISSLCSVLELPRPKIRIPYRLGVAVALGVETASKLAKVEPPISRRTLEFFDTNNAFDISKARRVLEFKPRFTFEEGLRESRTWLLQRT